MINVGLNHRDTWHNRKPKTDDDQVIGGGANKPLNYNWPSVWKSELSANVDFFIDIRFK